MHLVKKNSNFTLWQTQSHKLLHITTKTIILHCGEGFIIAEHVTHTPCQLHLDTGRVASSLRASRHHNKAAALQRGDCPDVANNVTHATSQVPLHAGSVTSTARISQCHETEPPFLSAANALQLPKTWRTTLVNCSITLMKFVQVLLTVAKRVKVPDKVERKKNPDNIAHTTSQLLPGMFY